MATERLTIKERLEKETAKLDKLKKKRALLDQQIRKSESTIENLRLTAQDQRMNAMVDMAENMGLTMDDIFAALQTGDLAALTKKAEEAVAEKDTDVLNGEGDGNT